MTRMRAASLAAVMSPKPTVAKMVTVKYSESVRVSGLHVEVAGIGPSHHEIRGREKQQEQWCGGSERFDRFQGRMSRSNYRSHLKGRDGGQRQQSDRQG